MAKREFIAKGGETWTWEETKETVEALKKLHETVARNKSKTDEVPRRSKSN